MEDFSGFERMDLLSRIRELVHSGSNEKALELCKRGIEEYPEEQVAFVLLSGHASLGQKSFVEATEAYAKVLDIVGNTSEKTVDVQGCTIESRVILLEAWKGLQQVYGLRGDTKNQVECLENVLKLTSEGDPGDANIRIELAEKYIEIGEHEKGQHQFWQVLHNMPVGSQERLDCLCKMADSMLKQKETHVEKEVELKIKDSVTDDTIGEEDRTISCIKLDVMAAVAARDDDLHDVGVSLNHILVEIMETSPASLKYLPYREEYLQRCLLRIFHHPPRSAERQQFRLAALRECVKIICTGGACSSFAFEAAVWLLEEEEEITGGQVSVGGQEVGGVQTVAGGVQTGAEGHIGQGRQATVAFAVENFSRRMYHQFPTNPTARVLMTLMIRRRAMLSKHPVPQAERRKWEETLEDAMKDDDRIDCASGFKALAELHYENRNYQKAHDDSLRGLKWLQERRDRGHESLSQVGLGLRLVLAKSLRRLKRLDEAEEQFKALAGWVSEGEIAFCEMCGSAPTSIHQQALRGTALVAVERGDLDAALSQYERILGKAALGRGPAEHWAHADYGWLLYQQGDLEQARFHLEKAINVCEEEGCSATDSQVGEHHYRLGEIYWSLGGKLKTDKQYAYTMFYESAKVEGHAQASAVAALGRYYDEVEHNSATAQRCYKKALSIDPSLNIAGELLCRHMLKEGKSNQDVINLCSILRERHPDAIWVYREIGAAELRRKEWSKAIPPLLKAVKLDGKDALSWENLGLTYYNLGRLASARKSLNRAFELDKKRQYTNLMRAWLSVSIKPDLHSGCHPCSVDSPLYYLSEAYKLFQEAMKHIMRGALCTAKVQLDECSKHLKKCIHGDGTLSAAHKLQGDVTFIRLKIDVLTKVVSGQEVGQAEMLETWDGAKRSIRRAFAKAIHLRPFESSLWGNMCLSLGTKYSKSEWMDLGILAPSEIVERCLMAGIRLEPDSSRNWLSLGCFLLNRDPFLSKYALLRSLQLNKKNFNAWECMSNVTDQDSLEMDFCHQQAQAFKEDSLDVWSRIVQSKCDAGSDLYSKINVAAVFGPKLMESFMGKSFSEDAKDGSTAFAAALTAQCLDPLNPDLFVSLWMASLRYGKFGVCRRLYGVFFETLEETMIPSAVAPTWKIGLSHIDQGGIPSLPIVCPTDPDSAKKVIQYLNESNLDATCPELLLYLFDCILTLYHWQSTEYSDCTCAIKKILVLGSKHIENFANAYQEPLISRLGTFYEIVHQAEGTDFLLSKLKADISPFLGDLPGFSAVSEATTSWINKITNENKCNPAEYSKDIDVLKAIHSYPWMMGAMVSQ